MGGGDGKGKGGGKGSEGDSHGGGKISHHAAASASHYTNGHMSGMTSPGVDEHSSFDDGFAPYARFFFIYGITVRPDGSVIWAADAGNNKIRNISCTGIGAPTFDPTAEPTKRPVFDPTASPSFKPSAVPSSKPIMTVGAKKATQAPASGAVPPKDGRNAPPTAPQVTKAPSNKAVKGASLSDVGSGVTGVASHFTPVEIAVISVCAFLVALMASLVLYHRQRIINAILMYASVSTEEKVVSGSPIEAKTSPDDFGMEVVHTGV